MMREAFDRQHAASRGSPIPDAAARRAALATLYGLVRDNTDAFARAIAEDFGGRARRETEILEAIPTLNAIRHARKWVKEWLRPEHRKVDWLFQPARAWVRYEPLGVVGVLSPWNFPLLLSLVPLANVLSAGNRAMIKPSELTPAFSELLRRLVAERFDPGQVTVICGGVEVARAFSSLPFDHLLFTGSTATGREVMRAAAENLTPVTLELGGKSPAIIAADFPLAKAARSIAFGKWLNAGQTCVAPDYVLVPAARATAFAQVLIEEARRGYPSIANDDYTSVITERHQARLNAAIDEAAAAGAVIIRHGGEHAGTRKIAPTVVLGAPAGSLLLREEIFGPVLPVVPYEHLDDALAFINARDRPRALYCFTNDKRVPLRVGSHSTARYFMRGTTVFHSAASGPAAWAPITAATDSAASAMHARCIRSVR